MECISLFFTYASFQETHFMPLQPPGEVGYFHLKNYRKNYFLFLHLELFDIPENS